MLVTRIDGGNPNLNSDNRQVWKAGFNLKPWSGTDFRFSSTWTRSLTDDAIAAFPTLTPDLEAALPEPLRARSTPTANCSPSTPAPLNFERFERQDIRTGFNYLPRLRHAQSGAADAPARHARRRAVRPAAADRRCAVGLRGGGGGDRPRRRRRRPGPDGRRAAAGGGGGGGMQPGQGRFNLSIYHTYRIQDEIVIADGLPVLDLLDGAATARAAAVPGTRSRPRPASSATASAPSSTPTGARAPASTAAPAPT